MDVDKKNHWDTGPIALAAKLTSEQQSLFDFAEILL